jgi:hypothetical protein
VYYIVGISYRMIYTNFDICLLFQSEVFAVAFAVLAAGAIVLTFNVLLLVWPSSHVTYI